MSPRRIAKFLAIFGSITLMAILVLTVTVVHRRSAQQKLKIVGAIVPGALLHAHNFHWTQMRGDKSQWVLSASDASYASDKTTIILVQPRLTMTAQDGKHLALTASQARLTVNGNHIRKADLLGNLRVDYGEFVLLTGQATFLPDEDQLRAPGMVKIKGPGLQVAGIGLTGHPKAQTFELLSQVNTVVEVKPKNRSAKPS